MKCSDERLGCYKFLSKVFDWNIWMKDVAFYWLCKYKCSCKINNLVSKETDISIFFIFQSPPTLLTSFSFPGAFWSVLYTAHIPTGSFSVTPLCSDFSFPEFPGCLRLFSICKTALEAHVAEFFLSCNLIVK